MASLMNKAAQPVRDLTSYYPGYHVDNTECNARYRTFPGFAGVLTVTYDT